MWGRSCWRLRSLNGAALTDLSHGCHGMADGHGMERRIPAKKRTTAKKVRPCDDTMPVDAMIAGALPLPYFGWRGALGEWASVFGVGSGAG